MLSEEIDVLVCVTDIVIVAKALAVAVDVTVASGVAVIVSETLLVVEVVVVIDTDSVPCTEGEVIIVSDPTSDHDDVIVNVT
jgi:hypothetical protein